MMQRGDLPWWPRTWALAAARGLREDTRGGSTHPRGPEPAPPSEGVGVGPGDDPVLAPPACPVRPEQRLPCQSMLGILCAVLVALFVLPAPWGVVLVGAAIAGEIAEKAFWLHSTRRIPLAVGKEALI